MAELLPIVLGSVLVNLIVLTSLPAWRPFAGLPGIFANAAGLGVATILTMPAVAGLSWIVTTAVLAPWHLEYLRTPAFVMLALIVAPLVELLLRRHGRLLPQRPGFPLLMSANTSVLGAALLTTASMSSLLAALGLALGIGLACAVLLLALAAMLERLQESAVPAAFRGIPLTLISAGIAALALLGFTGLLQE